MNSTPKALIYISCLLALFTTQAFAHSDGGIMVKSAWVREAPPNAKMLAAYLVIENHTSKPAILKGASSAAFTKVEIHKSMVKGGMASMAQQKALTIPAEGKVELKPGGYHLMLINPGTALKAGDKVSLTLEFANGSKSIVTAEVKRAMGKSEHEHEHEHHHDSEHHHHD